MPADNVRVRIAPSPTGYLHVGTARTAIFNWLFARHTGGRFLVRIEDTDKERSRPELIEPILDALAWLGLEWDEDLVYQSRRSDLYRQATQKILESEYGYRCFCTQEELQAARKKAAAEKKPLQYDKLCLQLSDDEVRTRLEQNQPYTIRINISEGETTYNDLVSGDLTRSNAEIEDFIIARADGSATYNLAVVVDDHDMGITHVIRGNDHVTNTFKQIHIYRALGFDMPTFGHVPLILRPDKKKVSKRLGDKDVNEYKAEGYLPGALFNYLCLLGWSPKTDREIYTREELVGIFDPSNFNTSNAVFDEEKLLAFNGEHIRIMSDHDLAALVAPMLVAADVQTKYWFETRWEYLRAVVGLLKQRARRLSDFVSMGRYFFEFDYDYDAEAAARNFSPEAADLMELLIAKFEALNEFTHDNTEQALSEAAEEKGVKRAKLIHPTRLAVSGVSAGPGLFDILVVLGKRVVVERMNKAVAYIKTNHVKQL